MMLFSSFGYEIDRQFGWSVGQVTATDLGRFALKTALFWRATTPAICGLVLVPQFPEPGQTWVDVGGVLAKSAPIVLKSGPAEAVITLLVIVLLLMFPAVESRRDDTQPSQPATLAAHMLFV